MSSLLLVQTLPHYHPRRHRRQALHLAIYSLSLRRHNSVAAESLSRPNGTVLTADSGDGRQGGKAAQETPKWEDSEFMKWRKIEAEILKDIEDIWYLTKDILHSKRYESGQRLTAEDEKAVVEKLLSYHPHREDKLGSGLHYIRVDRHPQFEKSRCLFVVRTDGSWIDFSYHKCIRSYVRDKYPSYAERFIREHFKRNSS